MTLFSPPPLLEAKGMRQSALVLPAPGPGMGPVVDLGQVLKVQVSVDLRRADVRVAQQLLDGTQITAGFEHVTGE